MDDKKFSRYMVVHYAMESSIVNYFDKIEEANAFIGLLLGHTNITDIELIGVVEEKHLLKRWGGNVSD